MTLARAVALVLRRLGFAAGPDSPPTPMKLIVGLGNPGRQYQQTRHNVGFEILDRLAERFGDSASKEKFNGRLQEAMIGHERVRLLWPHTLMNRSGRSVQQAVDFYQMELADLLIVCDDFQLPLGTLRFRRRGSDGGQKGLKDIIGRLGSDEFSRLRIGIGPVPERWAPADFVLSRFQPAERETVDEILARAAAGVEGWVGQGIDAAMNQFN